MSRFLRFDVPSIDGYNIFLFPFDSPDIIIMHFTSFEYATFPLSDMVDNVLWYYSNVGFDDCVMEFDGSTYISIIPKEAF